MKIIRRMDRMLLDFAKGTAKGAARLRNITQSRKSARATYRKILATRGQDPIDNETQGRIRRYSRQRFGSESYAPWLMVYTACCGEFRDGWIPEDFILYSVLPVMNPREIANISNVKTSNTTVLGKSHLPDLARFVNGVWFDPDDNIIEKSSVSRTLFRDFDQVYAKIDYVDRGMGVRILRQDDFDDYVNSSRSDFVIQSPVDPHRSLARFYADAVATLRVLTYMPPGGPPALRAAYLRLGRGNARFVSASSNAVKVAVNNHEGDLAASGVDDDWLVYERHPDSEIPFAGFRVPSFPESVTLCENLHKRMPQLALIGWDIVIDNDLVPWVLEWNAVSPAFKYIEAIAGPEPVNNSV